MSEQNPVRMQQVLERLRSVAAELSGYDPKDLVETSTFLELGFDSLFLTQLASAFQGEYGLKITFRQLFDELPTLRAMAEHIDRQLPAAPPAAAPVPTPALPVADPAQPLATLPPMPALELPRPIALEPIGAARVAGLQGVLAQQLALMAQQLQVMQGLRSLPGTVAAAPALAPVEVAAAPVAAAAMPATTAVVETPALPKGFGPHVSREERVLGPRQRDHLDRLIARYNAKTAGSKQRTQKHRAHHADPRTAAGFNRLWKEMVYPIVVERSSGCHLYDVDGNEYIDILNGFGPNFLGHNPPFIKEALKRQIDLGIEVGPQTPLAGEAAELFCELTGMDRVSWVNTGSEAVQAAIRLARTYTGRNRIVVFSGDYHGNFDEVLVRVTKSAGGQRRTLPLAPGIPFRAVEDVLVLDYGIDESLDIIRQHADEIAAVLVEPVQSRRPDFQPREFLHELRRLTEKEGIVLVFDEVITGFRICPGGAQEYYGVKADLATYGKIVGGGMPIGVVAGRAKFMDTFDGGMWQYGDESFPSAGVTFFAGTFVRHPLAIAAVHAALRYVKEQGAALQENVNRRTTRYTSELNRFFEERGVAIRIPHFASQMFIKVQEESELATLLFYHLRDRGIHVLEGFPSYMTAAHTDADVDKIIAAFKDSILEMQADGILPSPKAEATLPWVRRLPLTSGQHEVWMAAQLGEMASCAFNESDSVVIEGPLDAELFRRVVAEALGRHEAFKLRFDRDGAWQWVDEGARFDVPLVDLSTVAAHEQPARLSALVDHEALTPFDLEKGPLVRVHLVKLGVQSHLFVIYCHHIVFDGYSSELLMRDIAGAYTAARRGTPVPGLGIRPYSLFVHRSQRPKHDAAAQASLEHWRALFADELPPPLDLPTDRPRASQRNYRGATVHRELDSGLSHELRDAARTLKISLGTLLLAGFEALLSRLSSQEDFVVGIPSAGQSHLQVDAVGYCVNALPLRAAPAHDKAFATLLAETRRATLDAVEHQETSLGELVAALNIPRDPSRLPLVEVIFNHSRYFADLELDGCRVRTHENHRRAVYYELFFNIVEADGRLVVDWDYCSDLYDAATIERWIGHYCELLRSAIRDPSQPIGDLPLLSDQQGAEVIAMWGRR